MTRILVATDAFHPQVNGVVRSLEVLRSAALAQDVRIEFLHPQGFRTVPMPSYPEIRLALTGARGVARRLDALGAGGPIDHVHIATEGPIGWATRRTCLRLGLPFTTSYHTNFPDYIAARWPVPVRASYALLRRFHNAGQGIMVSTPTLARDLAGRGFARLMPWSRGVDAAFFHPDKRRPWDLPKPIFLYAGRLAPEKNLEAFLALDLPGSKVVVGDGPAAATLRQAFPAAHFLGLRRGEDLARAYASADVFVFPSRTDTFGIVLLEALSSGLPVAALPVPGPLDVIGASGAGVCDEDLRAACVSALDIPRAVARAHANGFTWARSARQFLDNVAIARGGRVTRTSTGSGEQRQLSGEGQTVEF